MWMLTLIFMFSSFAAIDYGQKPIKETKSNSSGKKRSVNAELGSNSRSFNPIFEISASYEGHKIHSTDYDAKMTLFRLKGEIRPIEEIFMNVSYWQGQSTSSHLSMDPTYQKGNLTALLGINWFSMGSNLDKTRVDLHIGAMLGQNEGYLGVSRTDKIVGFDSSKRFNSILLGIGAQLTVTGSPKRDDELYIGNITKYSFALGWIVSHDIRFALEANSYQLYSGNKDDSIDLNRILKKDVRFSTFSPSLYLSLGETSLEVYLGMHIRTKRLVSEQDITKAKLYEIPGAYGNCLLTGLTFTL